MSAAAATPTIARLPVLRTSRSATVLSILFADAVAILGTGAAAVLLRLYFSGDFELISYARLAPSFILFLILFALMGLYPGVVLNPVEELRRVFHAVTATYLLLGSATFLFREAETYSRGAFLIAWALSIPAVVLARTLTRRWLKDRPWWGFHAVVFSAGANGARVAQMLDENPALGLKIVAVLDSAGDNDSARFSGIPYAILATPGVPSQRLVDLVDGAANGFPHLLIIPDLFGMSSLCVDAKDLGGVLGLEVRQALLSRGSQRLKRAFDLIAASLGGLLLLPLVGLIALLIKLDTRGPVFYRQTRYGRGGRRFRALKFRSMAPDAAQILDIYLRDNPSLDSEWQRTQKLKRDPRVTRVGQLLRKTSLDELPQLWNVLIGEMSLVGPRPIVKDEIARYGKNYAMFTRVTPGLTGLWQVSGRNNLTYEQRVSLDLYYVRNWSIWLDLHILARTFKVVLLGDGAY